MIGDGCARTGVRIAALSLSCLLAASTGSVRADQPGIVLVPVSVGEADPGEARRVLRDAARVFEQHGTESVSAEEALTLLQDSSRAPRTLGEADREQIGVAANAALDAASSGESEAALQHLERALAIGDRALESSNRDTRTAQQLYKACLLAVQVLALSGRDDDAVMQARDCLARSPDLQLPPTERRLYAPEVREALAQADARATNDRGAPVVIDSRPQGCPVYINGRRTGVTPYTLAAAKRRWLVQVDCNDRPGRVHVVTSGTVPSRIEIDAGFEASIREAAGALTLHLDDPNADPRRYAKHLGRVLNAQYVLLAFDVGGDRLSLQRISTAAEPRTSMIVPKSYSLEELGAALDQLVAPLVKRPEPEELAPVALNPTHNLGLSTWSKAVGIGAIGAGVVLAGLGGGTYRAQRQKQRAYFATPRDAEAYYKHGAAWSKARTAPYVLSSIGGAVALSGVLGLTLAASPNALPWWAAATAGAAGTTLGVWSIVSFAKGSACTPANHPDTRVCSARSDRRDLGYQLLWPGIVGLTTFAIKLTRGPWQKRAGLALGLQGPLQGGGVSLSGRF